MQLLFNIHITYYEIMITIGIASALMLFVLLGRILKIKDTLIRGYLALGLLSIAVAFLTGMLMQGVYNFIESGSFLRNGSTGISFLGALIGAAMTFVLGGLFLLPKISWLGQDARKYFPQMLSIATPALTIGHAFGRIGCFLVGCCYGKVTESWCGVLIRGEYRIPTNLIEALFLFCLTAYLVFLVLKKFRLVFAGYLIDYGIFRFVLEFFRDDDRGSFVPGLTPSQFWSLIMIVAGIILVILFIRKKQGWFSMNYSALEKPDINLD